MAPDPVRMSQLGSGPEAVLRIVSYFDELDESAANADMVVRSAAVAAECPAGARWASGTVVRYDATGQFGVAGDFPGAPRPGDEPAVWLERAGAERSLDAVLLARLRHVLRMAAGRTGPPGRVGDPALLEAVLSSSQSHEDRARAIRLLGLDATREVRVVAVSAYCPPEALRVIARELPDQVLRSASIGTTTAVLCYGAPDGCEFADRLQAAIVDAFPAPLPADADRGPWVGVGAPMNLFAASTSWQQARQALRFASSTCYGRRAVAYERLGALDLLADLPPERVRLHPDVARLNEIASDPTGALEVDTAEAFCVLGSLRRTAAELHLHHSTVAVRLAHLQSAMGWDLGDPIERFMATLVLVVRRTVVSAAELTETGPTAIRRAAVSAVSARPATG
jgi:hypothetical protein